MKKIFALGLIGLTSLTLQAGNLDAALTDLVASIQLGNPSFVTGSDATTSLTVGYNTLMLTDGQGRILVDIYLNGAQTIDQVGTSLTNAGAAVTGVNPYFQNGAISAYVPVTAIQSLAGLSGVKLMNMAAKPQTNVGKVTSQGTKVLRSDVANANGYVGTGITVGVLSDSYNTSGNAVNAAADIASGDLPAPKFVADLGGAATDEGRAMMQIVYDVAPGSSLCFATAFAGEASFASNIRALRTNPTCAADVIVDDVFYFDEPFFSDGMVAQAVNDVVTSSVLAGKKAAYFSSAGNYQGQGYNIANAQFSATPTGIGNINLASISSCGVVSPSSGNTAAAATSFLNFGGGVYAPSVTLSVGANGTGTLLLQWDDLFYQGKVTTDLNFYLFSSAGTCVFAVASNNISTTDNGYENFTAGFGASGGTFTGRLMIGRTSAGTKQAANVRLLALSGWSSPLFGVNTTPITFGHSSAANAVSVAAYVYSSPYNASPYVPAFEGFSSAGPAINAFDAAGNRLPVVETRKKPDIAAPDGVDTTFFYPNTDVEPDGFNNFFGTSAAAPHAAGVAALMLQKAGGPNSLTAQQIKSYLQNTAPARVIPYTAGSPVKGYSVLDGFGLIDAFAALGKVAAPVVNN